MGAYGGCLWIKRDAWLGTCWGAAGVVSVVCDLCHSCMVWCFGSGTLGMNFGMCVLGVGL